MSQSGPSDNSTGGNRASSQDFTSAVVDGITERVIQPLENRLQAHDQRFNDFESRSTEFQNNVLALLGNGGRPAPGPSAHGRSSGRQKVSTVPRPDKTSEKQMQNVVRRVLTTGCCITHLKDAKLGLTEEELQERIATDPPLAWRPDFLKLINDPANAFWVRKILDEVMSDAKALSLVAKGKIAKEFWTEECVRKHILAPMWNNIRKEVKKSVDGEAAARGKANHSKGNRDGRKKRLYNARLKLATGSDKHARFEYSHGDKMCRIPPELMVEEAMSDVVDDEYDSDSIPVKVRRNEYRNTRPLFEYEGRPPFFRPREPWNTIFAAMDKITSHKDKGFGIQARYYAGSITRGQKSQGSPEMASMIPTSVLYRCHISKEWYGLLSDDQHSVLKPSPPGWEVDEELVAASAAV